MNYASPGSGDRLSKLWRPALVAVSVIGLFANGALIFGIIEQLHQSAWAYHDLRQNPRIYGRLVDPSVIADLKSPTALWLWSTALFTATSVGLVLALHLLSAMYLFNLRPDSADKRLRQYVRWKPFGACLTSIALFFFCDANATFWQSASRHIPVGSGPPYLVTAIFFGCAWSPIWVIATRRRHIDASSVSRNW